MNKWDKVYIMSALKKSEPEGGDREYDGGGH